MRNERELRFYAEKLLLLLKAIGRAECLRDLGRRIRRSKQARWGNSEDDFWKGIVLACYRGNNGIMLLFNEWKCGYYRVEIWILCLDIIEWKSGYFRTEMWINERIVNFKRERRKDISEIKWTRRLIAVKKVINIWCLFTRSYKWAATCVRLLLRFKTSWVKQIRFWYRSSCW